LAGRLDIVKLLCSLPEIDPFITLHNGKFVFLIRMSFLEHTENVFTKENKPINVGMGFDDGFEDLADDAFTIERKPTPRDIAVDNGFYEIANFLDIFMKDLKQRHPVEKIDESLIPSD
jgi:hypothetical protein